MSTWVRHAPARRAWVEQIMGMPVSIHVSDPPWAYEPMDHTNDGLMNGYKWRIDVKPGVMGHEELIASLESAVKKHPKTIFFAWTGGTKQGDPHYYRVQAPAFLIQMDDTHNDTNHIHSVWREFKGDWGDDLLAQHYNASHK